jgi:hypothetical protein
MTIYSDGIGNKFLGDCIWANHNIVYPTTNFLQAYPHSSISVELTALCTQSGLQFRNVLSQNTFNNNTATLYDSSILTFGASSDSIDDRYIFTVPQFNSTASGGSVYDGHIIMFNNSGYTQTNNTISPTTNALLKISMGLSPSSPQIGTGTASLSNSVASGFTFTLSQSNPFSQMSWVGVSDGDSLALYCTQYNLSNNTVNKVFYYGGLLADVNTGFGYYSASSITRSIMLTNDRRGFFPLTDSLSHAIVGGHYIVSSPKFFLTTGDAQYPIVCADAQTPTSQWATDMYVFDNNSPLGFPAIGRVRNLLLAQGTFTIGKVVKIQGSAMPDAGQNSWLPVGSYAGKVVLMRCYTSVSL